MAALGLDEVASRHSQTAPEMAESDDRDHDHDRDYDNDVDVDDENQENQYDDNRDSITQQQKQQQQQQQRQQQGQSQDHTPNKPPPRKRRRLVISCTECHRRKQKCDRKLPCTNCQTRNKESACRYETGKPLRKENRNDYRNDSSAPSNEGPSPDSQQPPHTHASAVRSNTVTLGYTTNGNSPLDILTKIDGGGRAGASSGATGIFAGMGGDMFEGDSAGVRERYKSLIRQLPARSYLDQLMDIYDRDINWQYCGLDMPILQELVDQWYEVPFSLLNSSGPQALDPMLRALPAVMFHLMATALLYLPDSAHDTFNSLKYANMSFDDLALEYSESGVAILSLLGKRQMSIVTVLAGWLRAGFLKYTGQVTEAWHQIGSAIRDAQEIGLHRDQYDPQPAPEDSADTILDKLWMAQFRRRVWMTLIGWDLHTGAVLGRPTSVDFRQMNRSVPIDVVLPNDKKKMPLVPRGDDDPPTPLTRAIWAFEMIQPLREILDLEKEGPFPKDFSKVDNLHQQLVEIQNKTPAPFRLENPDTRFDHLPECWWLPLVRPNLPQMMAFNFMALHRPYIFTREKSRHEALRASIEMLETQRIYFSMMSPHQFKTFALFFGTFDAVVMVASIYILFPREHVELLPIAVQHFRWAVDRFERMAERNRLAQAALGVLNAIYIRFKKAVAAHFRCENGTCIARDSGITTGMAIVGGCPLPMSGGGGSDTHSHSQTHTPNSNANSNSSPSDLNSRPTTTTTPSSMTSTKHTATTIPGPPSTFGSSMSGGASSASTGLTPAGSLPGTDTTPNSSIFDATTTTTSAADPTAAAEWSFPADFDFSSIMPMYPMGDIVYNELTGVLANPNPNPTANSNPNNPSEGAWGQGMMPAGMGGGGGGQDMHDGNGMGSGGTGVGAGIMFDEEQPWQFGGDFGNDTIWNLLNQFPSQ